MKKWLKNSNIVFESVLIFQIVALAWILVSGYTVDMLEIDIPYTDFVGTTYPDDRGGWYVDGTLPLPTDRMFNSSPEIVLKKGTYDITLYYETDAEGNYCISTANTQGMFGLRADKIKLSPKNNKVTAMIYLDEDVTDYRLNTFFMGEGSLIVKGMKIQQTHAAVRLKATSLFVLFVVFDLGWQIHKKKTLQSLTTRQLAIGMGLILIILMVSYPLFGGYIMRSHDIGFHMLRIDGIAEGLLSGQFPVKIQPNWLEGYGYPASVYYGDLFLYFPGILRLIGFSATFSYHMLLLACNIATVLISYWCFKRIVKDDIIGIMGAFLYTTAPYRLTDLYVRNAVGEAFAITFFPLIFYGIYMVFSQKDEGKEYDRLWIPMVVGFGGVIQSHMLSCLMCGMFVLIACACCIKKVLHVKTFLVLAKTVVYTTLLNAWFLFPCMFSMKDIEVMQAYRGMDRIQERGTHLSQLFRLFYQGNGDAYSAEVGTYGEMALGVGLVLGLGLFLYVFAWIYSHQEQEKIPGRLIFGLCIFSIMLTTIYFPWDYLSAKVSILSMSIANLQFAWRFLAIANVLGTAVTCFAIKFFQDRGQNCNMIMIVLFLLAVVGVQYRLDNRLDIMGAEWLYDTASVGRTDYNVKEYLRPGTDIQVLDPNRIATDEKVELISYVKENISVEMTVKNLSGQNGYVEVPLLYYEWYQAKTQQNDRLDTTPGENNVLRVWIPAGYCGGVRIFFKEPLLWRGAEALSLLTVLIMVSVEIIRRRTWRKSKMENCSFQM